MIRLTLLLSSAWLLVTCQLPPAADAAPPAHLPETHCFPPETFRILIDKSDYELRLIADTVVVVTWPVVFGENPVDDKLRQGDRCTPEGLFRVRSKRIHAHWSRFIWIDYPTPESWEKHRAAKAAGQIPAHVGIGGEIGIHGVSEGLDYLIDERYNWTLGCISLKNAHVEALYPHVFDGMEVEIQP